MSNLQFVCIKELEEAQKMWKMFNADKMMYDLWDARYCFYKYFKYELFFYVGYDGDTPVGLLPLQYNSDEKYFEFFGGYFFCDNQVFIKPDYEEHIPEFYQQITGPAHLTEIIGSDSFTEKLPLQYYQYVMDISQYSSYQDFLEKHFRSKDRTNLKRKIKITEQEKIEIIKNNFSDLDLLIDFNIKHFGNNSYFTRPFRRNHIFHDLLKEKYDFHMLTFVVNGIKEAVSFAILYKDTYTYIHYGRNMDKYQHLGTYVSMQNLQHAISLGAKYFDAGAEDFGWKESWGFGKVPLHIYSTVEPVKTEQV